MDTSQLFTESYAGEEKSWRYIAIIAGLVACFVYPIVSYVPISSRQLQVFLVRDRWHPAVSTAYPPPGFQGDLD